MTAKIGTVRMERDKAIQGQKDMRRTNRALRRERDAACSLLREILAKSTAFDSALEIDSFGDFSGVEWSDRASKFLEGVKDNG